MKLTKQFYLKFKFFKFLRFHQKKKKKKKNDDYEKDRAEKEQLIKYLREQVFSHNSNSEQLKFNI